MRTNFVQYCSTQFRVLSDSQIEEVLLAAMEVLESVGMQVHHEEVLALLRHAGVPITGEKVAHISSSLVKQCLATAPKRIAVSRRDGQRTLLLENHKMFFGAGSDTPFVIDPYTGERRKCTTKDVENAARVADALPNLDFHMSLGLVSDVSPEVYDRHQFAAMLCNTSKPIVVTAVDGDGLLDILEMCYAVAGGEEEFCRNPFIVLYGESITPLVHGRQALEKLLLAAEKGIPQIYTSAPLAGCSAPVTFAGVLVLSCAEFFGGLVISQLKRKGAPIICGGTPAVFDMSTLIMSYGAEMYLLCAALSDIAHYLQIPVFSVAGVSDSKTLDEQAGIEAGLSTLMAALSGANLIHDVGYLESAMTGSMEMLVMCDEIISMVKRIVQGIQVDEEMLAVDVIKKVGPGGNFLQESHTRRHFKEQLWFPKLVNRSIYKDWVDEGRPTLRDRVRRRVRDIIENYQPEPLPKDVLEKIRDILDRADRKISVSQ